MYKSHATPKPKQIKLELHKKAKWSNQIKRWLQNDKHFSKLIMQVNYLFLNPQKLVATHIPIFQHLVALVAPPHPKELYKCDNGNGT